MTEAITGMTMTNQEKEAFGAMLEALRKLENEASLRDDGFGALFANRDFDQAREAVRLAEQAPAEAGSIPRFEDLPIKISDYEFSQEGWRRPTTRDGTVAELLTTWDIDDPSEQTEIAQVMRYLRRIMETGNPCA